MTPTFAVGVPHTPWNVDRVVSLGQLAATLKTWDLENFQLFEEQESYVEWSKKLWEWGLTRDTTHLLQLQDDVIAAPNFWPAINAMVEAVPDKIIGLQGAHPINRTLARDGHRWARSHAWMVGVGYIIPRSDLEELVKFRGIFDGIAHEKTEDEFIAWFCTETGRDVWHPIPTIIDHDTELPSTYAHLGNDKHEFRRPTVTWREFGEDEITRLDFWQPRADVPIITSPFSQRCWFCQQEPHIIGFKETGALIGRACLVNALAGVMGVKRA